MAMTPMRVWAAATLNPPPPPLLLLFSHPDRLLRAVVAAEGAPPPAQPPAKFVCRRAKNATYDDYKFPDPIPEFAEQETSKFKEHMTWRPEQKEEEYFGEHVEEIVDICT